MLLKGKVAVVTGAASGIGEEIARTFAKQGAKVGIADMNLQDAEKVASSIRDDKGEAMAIAMDVTSESQVTSGIDELAAAYGGIDVLVSNAGIQIISPIQDLPFEKWKKLLAIQLDGAFLTTKACVKYMYKNKFGRLIYTGSVHSHEASALKTPYVTSKHGLLGLCKTMAKEGAEYNVGANVICPGYVKTPLVAKQIPEQAKDLGISEEDVIKKVMLKDTVDGKFTTTQDVADAALFFASFNSNALTGQSLVVSHGWFMQ